MPRLCSSLAGGAPSHFRDNSQGVEDPLTMQIETLWSSGLQKPAPPFPRGKTVTLGCSARRGQARHLGHICGFQALAYSPVSFCEPTLPGLVAGLISSWRYIPVHFLPTPRLSLSSSNLLP